MERFLKKDYTENASGGEEDVFLRRLKEMSPKDFQPLFEELEKSGSLENFVEWAACDPIARAILSYWEKWISEQFREKFEIAVKKGYAEMISCDMPLSLLSRKKAPK